MDASRWCTRTTAPTDTEGQTVAISCTAEHTAVRGSGRVGRSEAGRNLDEKALTLAVGAAVRHNHTPYDELLASGVDRADARRQIAGKVDEVLAKWRK
jgi:hypothetical protein